VQVTARLVSDLRKYLRGRPEPLRCEMVEGASVADLIVALGIDPAEEITVGVNGVLSTRQRVLEDGDEVLLLTPMSGG
jgi:sulfur carrier protein ThiS